jgi:conjugal transfer mating pair stabilization protein TraG
MKRIFILLLALVSFSFGAETVYAWGYGDLLVETLKVVKYIFTVSSFEDVWKLAMLITMTIATIASLTPQTDFLRLPKLIIMSTGIWTIFTTSTIDIYVDDKADNTKSGVVTSVPWGVGYPVALFSTLEYQLGTIYETATSIPSGLKYSDSGLLTPLSLFSQASSHRIVDPTLFQNVDNYIYECVIPDLENGYKDYVELTTTEDVWSYMSNTSPTVIVQYLNDDNTTELKNCNDFYSSINSRMMTYAGSSGQAMGYMSKIIGFGSASTLSSLLGTTNQFLVGSSKTATQMLVQNIAINTFTTSYSDYLNGVSRTATGMGEANAESQMQISSNLAKKYIPIMKGILTIIVIGLTPIMALMMITPIGMKTVIGYMMMLFWLATWHLGDAIFNHIIITKMKDEFTTIGNTTMQMKGLIDESTLRYIDMAGNMYWMIPSIGLVVASGFSLMALASLNSAMAQPFGRGVSSVAGQTSAGNMAMGNVQHDNYSANKFDTTRAVSQGSSFSYNDSSSANRSNGMNTSSVGNGDIKNSGMQGVNAVSKGDGSFGSLMNGAGQSQSFDSFTGVKEQMGTTQNGQTIYSVAGGNLSSSSSGDVSKAGSDAMMTANQQGQFVPWSGTFSTQTKNDKGEEMSIEKKFNQGEAVSTVATDKAGNTVSIQKDKEGNSQFTWTSGEDKKTTASGYIDESGYAHISSATVDGVKHETGKSTSTNYSSSTASKVADTISETWGKGMTSTTGNSKDFGYGERFNRGADGKIQISSNDQLAGMILAKGTGLSASAGMGLGLSYDNSGTAKFTDANGKTETISLSGDARKSFESALQKSMSDEERTSSGRDLVVKDIEQRINNGLNNGATVNDVMSGTVRDKDNIVGNVGQGIASEVNNMERVNGKDSNQTIENSALYNQKDENGNKKWQNRDNEIKTDAIILTSNGEKLTEENGYDKKTNAVTNQKEFDKLYDRAKNENVQGTAVDSAVQVVQNVGGSLGEVGEKVIEKSQALNENVASTYKLDGKKYNPDGERTENWVGETPPTVQKTSRDLIKELDKDGVVDYSTMFNSEVKDWNKVESLKKEDVQRMIQFNDWDKETESRLNQIANSKNDNTNFVPDINGKNTGVTNIGSNMNGNGNGEFSLNKGTEGLTNALKIADTSSKNNSNVEKIALEVDKMDKKSSDGDSPFKSKSNN